MQQVIIIFTIVFLDGLGSFCRDGECVIGWLIIEIQGA